MNIIYKYCFLPWIFENGKKYESTKYESTEMGRHTLSLYSTTRQDDFFEKMGKKYPLKYAVFAY